jgi:hypothetical protein
LAEKMKSVCVEGDGIMAEREREGEQRKSF